LQERAALGLLIADFRECPDLFGDGGIAFALRVDALGELGAFVAGAALRQNCWRHSQ